MSANGKHIWINGHPVEVTEEVYEAYMTGDRKMRYFEEDLKKERIELGEDGRVKRIIASREDSLERLMDDNSEQYADGQESVEDTVCWQIAMKKLHTALSKLPNEEQMLIRALYFQEQTEAAVGAGFGISQQAVHKRKEKILKKLKLFLEN